MDVTEQLIYRDLRAGMIIPGGVVLNEFSVFTIAVDAPHVSRLEDGIWDITARYHLLTNRVGNGSVRHSLTALRCKHRALERLG